LALALVLALTGACTGVAAAPGNDADVVGTMAARGVTVDPCSLLTTVEVEKALSTTIGSSRQRTDDPMTQAFTVALSEQVCEYYGVPGTPSRSPTDTAASGPSERASELRVDEALEEIDESLGESNQNVVRARQHADKIEAHLRALELSVIVHPRPLSRDQFETFHEHRMREFAVGGRVRSEDEDLAAAVVGRASRFVEEATDRATDVGGIGDAARWYPALAQLHVLVGDVAFGVTSLKQSPMMTGMLFDTPVEPVYDPPPELVELARIAADRLDAQLGRTR
jgi:hypothetical protein